MGGPSKRSEARGMLAISRGLGVPDRSCGSRYNAREPSRGDSASEFSPGDRRCITPTLTGYQTSLSPLWAHLSCRHGTRPGRTDNSISTAASIRPMRRLVR